MIKLKSKKSSTKKSLKILTSKNTVHIMQILPALTKDLSLVMVNFMGLLDHQGKDGYGILKILQILKILLKKLLLSKQMSNSVILLSIPKYKAFQLLLQISVPQLQMVNFYFGLLIQNYLNKNHSNSALILIESIRLIIMKVGIIFWAVLMTWVGPFGMQHDFNKFLHKKGIKDKFIVLHFIPMDLCTLQEIWEDGDKFGI